VTPFREDTVEPAKWIVHRPLDRGHSVWHGDGLWAVAAGPPVAHGPAAMRTDQVGRRLAVCCCMPSPETQYQPTLPGADAPLIFYALSSFFIATSLVGIDYSTRGASSGRFLPRL